jgi:hypothetical protein
MTILAQIIHDILIATQHAFFTDGLRLWCAKPARIIDPMHPNRLMDVHCIVSQVKGFAHPASAG